MPEEQRILALRSIDLAKRGLGTCLRSPNYKSGLKYGALAFSTLFFSCAGKISLTFSD
jgi:hypothetical protein